MPPETSASFPNQLPNEIWCSIIQYYALQPLTLGHAGPDATFRANRSALRCLCSTAHRFLDIARPYLYETIIISLDEDSHVDSHVSPNKYCPGAASLVRLLRTLVENKDLRPLIKHLAVPITLGSGSVREGSYFHCQNIALTWLDHSVYFESLPEADQKLFTAARLSVEASRQAIEKESKMPVQFLRGSAYPSFAQSLLAILLCMTCGVERLLLHGDYHQLYQVFNRTLHRLLDSKDLSTQVLPVLSTLQIQHDPNGSEGSYHLFNLAAISAAEALLRQPKLRRLDLFNGMLLDCDRFELEDMTKELQELNLAVTSDANALWDVLKPAVCLKSLNLDLCKPTGINWGAPLNGRDLNSVLLTRAQTLEALSFKAPNFSSDDFSDQLGPQGRLSCLPELKRLKYLCVEPHLLIDWINANTWPTFFRMLPPNLETLAFRFHPEDGEDLLRIWARSGIGAILRSSRETWQEKMPHLRHIHLVPLTYPDKAVEDIKADLQDAGIHLTWQNEV